MVQNDFDLDFNIPPQSTEAEMSALGAAILSMNSAKEITDNLHPGEFYVPAHRIIFESIKSLVSGGRAIDLVSLRDHLTSRMKLDEVGGIEYLVQIAETVPSAANGMTYAGIVRDKALLRSLEQSGNQIIKLARELDKSPTEKVNESLAKIAKLTRYSTTVDHMVGVDEIKLEENVKGTPIGLPTINKVIDGGGLPGGQITTVMADSGIGKTPMVTQFADHILRQGGRVCIVLFADLSPARWKRRFLKLRTGRSSPSEDLEAAEAWRTVLSEFDDPFRDGPSQLMLYNAQKSDDSATIEVVLSRVMAEHAKSPFTMVGFDYFQKIRTQQQFRAIPEQSKAVVDKLEAAAAEFGDNCISVVASQITRSASGENHARYGQELTSASGFAFEIKRERGKADTDLLIKKNRFGPEFKLEGFEFDDRYLVFRDPLEDW